MTSMVDRVARAICWKNGMNPDLTLGGDGVNFLWHEYVAQAEAAIEAMREPSEKMVSVGVEHRLKISIFGAGGWKNDTRDLFKEMIDAALNEKE